MDAFRNDFSVSILYILLSICYVMVQFQQNGESFYSPYSKKHIYLTPVIQCHAEDYRSLMYCLILNDGLTECTESNDILCRMVLEKVEILQIILIM